MLFDIKHRSISGFARGNPDPYLHCFKIYNIIRCSRMWRHSHCPSPRSFFLFRQFDSENCNLTDVKPSIKTSPNVPYLFITTFFASYRSGERVMGAFLQPTFSFPSLLFPFVLSVKSFCRPIVLLRFMTSKNWCRSKPLWWLFGFFKNPKVISICSGCVGTHLERDSAPGAS